MMILERKIVKNDSSEQEVMKQDNFEKDISILKRRIWKKTNPNKNDLKDDNSGQTKIEKGQVGNGPI